MLEMNKEVLILPNESTIKSITPIKYSKRDATPKSTGGKANPMASGYAGQYQKRKESKGKHAKFINKPTERLAQLRSRSVVPDAKSQTMNSSSGAYSKVLDLKEIRDKEKKQKQAKLGHYGAQVEKMLANNNFNQMAKNYSNNLINLRLTAGATHGTYKPNEPEMFDRHVDTSLSHRAQSNTSQQNRTYNV